jgi:hypothetical protein
MVEAKEVQEEEEMNSLDRIEEQIQEKEKEMNSVERELVERLKILDQMEARIAKLEGRKTPLPHPDVARLVDSLFELYAHDTQGTPVPSAVMGVDMYREAIKNWWGERESHDLIEQAIQEVIVTTCQEQELETTYQMVDWLRNTMGYEP